MICSSVLLDITSSLCVCCVRMSSLKSLIHNVLPFCSGSVCSLLPCSLFYQSIFSGLILLLSNSRVFCRISLWLVNPSGTSCGIRSPTVFTFARALLTFAACLTKFIPARPLLISFQCIKALLALGIISFNYAFVFAIPSLMMEKRPDVGIETAVSLSGE